MGLLFLPLAPPSSALPARVFPLLIIQLELHHAVHDGCPEGKTFPSHAQNCHEKRVGQQRREYTPFLAEDPARRRAYISEHSPSPSRTQPCMPSWNRKMTASTNKYQGARSKLVLDGSPSDAIEAQRRQRENAHVEQTQLCSSSSRCHWYLNPATQQRRSAPIKVLTTIGTIGKAP